MSLLDIRHAKEALAWRLKEWGVADYTTLAASFIDDLVEKGWRMDATRELRAAIPKPHEVCPECNGHVGNCACRVKHLVRDDPDPHPRSHADASFDASLARAELALARGRLCVCGVARETCPTHREAAAAAEEAS